MACMNELGDPRIHHGRTEPSHSKIHFSIDRLVHDSQTCCTARVFFILWKVAHDKRTRLKNCRVRDLFIPFFFLFVILKTLTTGK